MNMTESAPTSPDSQYRGLMRLLPGVLRPYAALARLDRPIGWWLLFWPCAWGLALAGDAVSHWQLMLWLMLGAVAMRGAGCVYNDIIDRDLDAQVERTRSRPLPAGHISVRAAWLWLLALCGVGLLVLMQLNRQAQMIALGSLALVAAYPFMKRITWWPQAWLGLVFSWGALVGWAAVTGSVALPTWALYAGTLCWVVGYDTIYALQDVEDDALAGIKSSARALGSWVRGGVGLCYALALVGWAAALWLMRSDYLSLLALLPAAVHLAWQVVMLKPADGADCLAKFRSNRYAGLLVFAAMFIVGMSRW